MSTQLHSSKRKAVTLILALCAACALLVGALAMQHAKATEAGFVIVQDYLDAGKTIQYIGNTDDTGSPFGMVMYNASSPDTLQAYADASRSQGQALVGAGVGEFYVWVTFRQPVDTHAFEALTTQYGFDVKHYYLRATGQNGTRVTISGGPDGSSIVPANQLDSAMNGVQTHENNQAQLKGVVEALGAVGASGYLELNRDPRVFMVDVTGTLIYLNPNFQSKTHMGWDEFATKFQIGGGPGGPYWYVEDFGLGKASN